jgi:Protein of unknown function (DUF2782)
MNTVCKIRCKACLFAVAAAASIGALAQLGPPPLPANAAPPPLPANAAPPPLPPGAVSAATASSSANSAPPIDYKGESDEPQVTIIHKDTETVEEVRVGGELRYIRVTPRRGPPYYLVPTGNGRTFNRMDSLGTGLSVPMWLLFSW